MNLFKCQSTFVAVALIRETVLISKYKLVFKDRGKSEYPGETTRAGGGGTWVNFRWVYAAGLSEPLLFNEQHFVDSAIKFALAFS